MTAPHDDQVQGSAAMPSPFVAPAAPPGAHRQGQAEPGLQTATLTFENYEEAEAPAGVTEADVSAAVTEALSGLGKNATEAARRSAVEGAVARLISPEMKQTRYRVWFVAGTLDVIGTAVWLGASPQTFYRLWLFKMAVIMAQRVWVFTRRRMLFFLLSLCYACSVAAGVYVLFFMHSIPLTKMIFAVGIAPMASTSLLMKNRLVLHDWNSLSLVFIHWGLGLLVWTLRWHPPPVLAAAAAAAPAEWAEASFTHFWVWPSLMYAAWGAAYLATVNVALAGVVRRGRYDTQYSKAREGGMGIISTITNVGPLWLRPLTFLFAQYALFALPLVYAQAAWRNYYVGGGILCAILAVCTWEGSGYYLRTPKVAAGGAPKHKGQ